MKAQTRELRFRVIGYIEVLKLKVICKQFSRHVVIVTIAFLIDYELMVLLTEYVNMYYLTSATLSFIIATVFNYIFSMHFVYKKRTDMSPKVLFVIFIVLSAFGLLLNNFLMYVIVDNIQVSYKVAKISAALIVSVYNFLSRKVSMEKHKAHDQVRVFLRERKALL